MIIAFTGWNDAGESASSLVQHLLAHWGHQLIAEYDPEDYYDYQVNRPFIRSEENKEREIVWPTTRVFAALTPELPHDFLLVLGAEPSMRWQGFSAELLDIADDYEVELALLVDCSLMFHTLVRYKLMSPRGIQMSQQGLMWSSRHTKERQAFSA